MILLRLLSWPYARKHVLRTLLTMAGIALGVAVFVGMHTANQGVMAAFNRTVNRIAGATQLQVTAGETGFEESVLEQVQSLGEVRVAVPVIEAVAATGIPGQGNLLILGVDMTGDRSLRDYDLETDDAVDDPLVFLAQPDSIILTSTFAATAGLSLNSKLPMNTMIGPRQFTVRGMMKPGGMTQAFGGNLAVMDVYAAQKVFGRGRRFDRIDLAVKEGVSVDAVQRQLQALLGPSLEVNAPSARGQQFEALSRAYAATANVTSGFALFIGLFIIYNTFQIAVAQRRSEVGILRALGATRRQVRSLFLGESLVLGLAGSGLGVLLGLVMAQGMAGSVSGLMADVYGVAQKVEQVPVAPGAMALALMLGVVTSVLAAWWPARAAARVDPVQALQKGRSLMIGAGETRMRQRIAGVLLLAVAGLLVWNSDSAIIAAYALATIAALMLTPWLMMVLVRVLRPVLGWLLPVEGALAADSLLEAPRRSSGTVAALMMAVSLAISLGGLAQSSYNSIASWLESVFNPDFFVTNTPAITDRSFRFPGAMGDELAGVPGVEEVQRVRSPRVIINGVPVMLISIETEGMDRRVRHKIVSGDATTMFRRMGAGEGVVASENFANQFHCRVGDAVAIPAASGLVRMPVLGIVLDYSDQRGSLFIDRKAYIRLFHDDSVNIFRVYRKPGVELAALKSAILDRFSANSRVFVFTNREIRDYVLRVTNQWFGLTYIQMAVAVLVAILGIVNSLTVSITDRRRELGVLQAVGALRWQVRHTIWMEALAIGVVGLALGFAMGAAALYFGIEIGMREMAGYRLNYEYPVRVALALIPVMLGAAFVSGIGPAESAVRGSLVEALEYE
jgi:putative ABC transport system permease protein